ncbi:hypothetical protein [Blastococcus sp. CT_GayMR16]|uniref:hypothetical protein n=1 Tax=Blastococcus sp. CT_GayMR16 TaxID=2559607 RepID=UPI0010748147|nr:hypothetical protein [Blastococcus sp. CT_GayMR16]TFV90363.1 hypothetical protein E4P38_02675 [Blastococcus sp. CT_GayMR16]
MTWVLLIGAVWLAVAALLGVLIGRGIRLADRKEEDSAAAEAASPNFVVDVPSPVVAGPAQPFTTDTADAVRDPATPDHMTPLIPTARPPAGRAPARASEQQMRKPRESGSF